MQLSRGHWSNVVRDPISDEGGLRGSKSVEGLWQFCLPAAQRCMLQRLRQLLGHSQIGVRMYGIIFREGCCPVRRGLRRFHFSRIMRVFLVFIVIHHLSHINRSCFPRCLRQEL